MAPRTTDRAAPAIPSRAARATSAFDDADSRMASAARSSHPPAAARATTGARSGRRFIQKALPMPSANEIQGKIRRSFFTSIMNAIEQKALDGGQHRVGPLDEHEVTGAAQMQVLRVLETSRDLA